MNYEQWLGALCCGRESRSCPEAMPAIWRTILNRANDSGKRWPRTIPGVITQRWQFSSFSLTDPNVARFPIPDNSPDWSAFIAAQQAVAMSTEPDPSGANSYESLPDVAI